MKYPVRKACASHRSGECGDLQVDILLGDGIGEKFLYQSYEYHVIIGLD